MVSAIFNRIEFSSAFSPDYDKDTAETVASFFLYFARVAFGQEFSVEQRGNTSLSHSYTYTKKQETSEISRVAFGVFAVLTALVFIPAGLIAMAFSKTFIGRIGGFDYVLTEYSQAMNAIKEEISKMDGIDMQTIEKNLLKIDPQDFVKLFDKNYVFSKKSGTGLMNLFLKMPSYMVRRLALFSTHSGLEHVFACCQDIEQMKFIVKVVGDMENQQQREVGGLSFNPISSVQLAAAIFSTFDSENGVSEKQKKVYIQALKTMCDPKNDYLDEDSIANSKYLDEDSIARSIPSDLSKEAYNLIAETFKDLPIIAARATELASEK